MGTWEGCAMVPPIIVGVGAGAYGPNAFCSADECDENPAKALMAVSIFSVSKSQQELTIVLRVLQCVIWRR